MNIVNIRLHGNALTVKLAKAIITCALAAVGFFPILLALIIFVHRPLIYFWNGLCYSTGACRQISYGRDAENIYDINVKDFRSRLGIVNSRDDEVRHFLKRARSEIGRAKVIDLDFWPARERIFFHSNLSTVAQIENSSTDGAWSMDGKNHSYAILTQNGIPGRFLYKACGSLTDVCGMRVQLNFSITYE